MISSRKRALTYAIYSAKKNLSEEEIDYPLNGSLIRIVPVITGSKRAGILQTIAGAALVTVGALGMSFGQAFGGATWGPYTMQAGLAVMAGGVIQMLSPQPAGLAIREDANNQASYAFGGITNTTAKGCPVPLLYGQRRIGGAVISAGIYAEDQQ